MTTQDKGIDFIAYDDAGRAILVAEVKSRVGTSATWAARFRRNVLAHGIVPKAPFFLIATPERMYFWKQDDPDFDEAPPEFTVDARKEFSQYLGNHPQEPVGEHALELLVLSWLTDIASTGAARAREDPSMRWLAESGLIESLDRARIEMNPA